MSKPVNVKWWHIALVLVGLFILSELFKSPDPEPAAAAAPAEAEKPKQPTQEEAYAKEVAALYRSLKAGEVGLKGIEDDRLIAEFAFDLYRIQDAASVVSNRDWLPGQDTAILVIAEFKKLFPKLYPEIRKRYAKAIGDRLWREDWKVEQRGKTITFIHYSFINNAAKEDVQKRIKFDLEMMRFTRAEYKAFDGQMEYTYYTIESRPDTQVGP